MDYSKLNKITVKSQEELDMIPVDFKGRIYIEFGTAWEPAVVKNRYGRSVVARGNSSVEAWGNSSVVAWDNSSVVARGNSSVVAWGNSSVEAWDNSSVEAWGNSSVVAWDNSSVEAWGNSSVDGAGNAQIVDRLNGGRIEITGNARIVYMPKTIEEYCSFYGLKHDKKKGVFYKCVHKQDERYFADYDDSFEYKIGETAIPNGFTENKYDDCGQGIHVAYMAWVSDFGRDWEDLAILEVEADLEDVLIPEGQPGKVRCRKVKVLREVSLSECGLYGKILEKRIAKDGN